MRKSTHERIREAQGERSKTIASQNRLIVFLTLVDKPLTFSELLKKTEFSRPVLAKHLRILQKRGSILKDTVKYGETSNPEEIGKIVYRVKTSEVIPDIVKALQQMLRMPSPKWDEELKAEIFLHYEEIAKILLKQWEIFHSRDRR